MTDSYSLVEGERRVLRLKPIIQARINFATRTLSFLTRKL